MQAATALPQTQNNNLLTQSDWSLHKQSLNTQKCFEMLLNRVAVLQRYRQRKSKQIQSAQKTHHRIVLGRIEKNQAKRQVKECINSPEQLIMNRTQSAFMRQSHRQTMEKIREHIKDLRSQEFRKTKQESFKRAQLVQDEKEKEREEKRKKSDQVKLKQVQSRQKIDKFWDWRLKGFREEKDEENKLRLSRLQANLESMNNLQKTEQALIEDLILADEIREKIAQRMTEEKHMKTQVFMQRYVLGRSNQQDKNRRHNTTPRKNASMRDQNASLISEERREGSKENKFRKID